MKIAVVKPDHLGDFILALPAIRALLAQEHDLTLFVSTANLALARHHFPALELVPLDLPYLTRRETAGGWSRAYAALGRLRAFDLVVFLREDGFMNAQNFREWTDYAINIRTNEQVHQTRIEHDAVSQIVGDYDVEGFFGANPPDDFSGRPAAVALAIGAGFPFKKWSPLAWAELAQILIERGVRVRLLSGPMEMGEAALIARSSGLDPAKDIFVGGSDFGALDQWVREHDLVVAVDGGSAHLCSLSRPVLSIFGPSPARRYCPVGVFNRVVTRQLPCHPCAGFDARALNACFTRECMYGLRPAHVIEAMAMRPGLPGFSRPLTGAGARVHFGLSAAAH